MFIRRARAALAVLLLLGSTMFITARPAFAAYYLSCSATENNYIWHQWHTVSNVQSAKGTTTIKDLHSCIDANGKQGASFVMVANIQDPVDCHPFAQIGYGRMGPDTSPLGFVFTPSVETCGTVAYLKDYFAGVPTPVSGETWTLTVGWNAVNALQSKWVYRLKKSGGSTYTYSRTTSATAQHSGNKQWWGIETWNLQSQFGGDGVKATISSLGYSTGQCCDTEPGWSYSTSINNDWVGSQPTWYLGTGAIDINGFTTISGSTTSH